MALNPQIFLDSPPWCLVSDRGIRARIIADSVNPDGDRLTTVECVFPRFILAEVNTHRMLSRNSASSRAIPVKRTMRQVWQDPACPVSWGTNRPGMQAREELVGWRRWLARQAFLWARLPALAFVWIISRVGLHKQVANRILESWMWHTAIISATEWDNFFKLRLHPDAQPEFQELAQCIRDAMRGSTPERLEWGQWHLPYVERFNQGLSLVQDVPHEVKESAARCARVSYVRQNEQRTVAEDIAFADRLTSAGHFSPLEHPARAERGRHGNFNGWKQLRQFYPGEDGKQA